MTTPPDPPQGSRPPCDPQPRQRAGTYAQVWRDEFQATQELRERFLREAETMAVEMASESSGLAATIRMTEGELDVPRLLADFRRQWEALLSQWAMRATGQWTLEISRRVAEPSVPTPTAPTTPTRPAVTTVPLRERHLHLVEGDRAREMSTETA